MYFCNIRFFIITGFIVTAFAVTFSAANKDDSNPKNSSAEDNRYMQPPLEDLLPPVRCHQITSLSDDEEWKVALLDAIAGQDDLIEMIDIAKNLYQSLRSRLNLIRAGVLSKAANKYLLNQVGQTYIRFETFCHETDFSPRTPDYLYFLENPIDKKCASEEGAKDMKEMKRIIWEQVALVNPVLAKMYIQCLEIAAFWNQMEDIRHDLQREEL